MDAQILNFKPYSSGAMVGFFDLEVHGLVITGCRGFRKGDALWFGWPSEKVPGDNGEVAYKDIIVCADPVMKHLQGLVRNQLRQLLEATPAATRPPASKPARKFGESGYRTPEGEDLSEYRSSGKDDGIPILEHVE